MTTATDRPPLEERVTDLLAEGGVWTMQQIAEALHASKSCVCTTLHKLESRGMACDAGHIPANGGGRNTRLFRCPSELDEKARAEAEIARSWPKADLALTAAIDAIARQR